jgi:hypothetical protein
MRPATMPCPPDEALHDILRCGIAAPSADNRHRLRFVIMEDGVSVIATDVAEWSAQPHRESLAHISHGALLENMSLRAAARGFPLTVRCAPDPARPEIVARCAWATASAPAEPLLDAAIERRRTNRRFYRRQRLGPDVLEDIAVAAGAVPHARLRWLDDAPWRRAALHAIRLAETERFRRESLHRELFDAIRFDAGWRRSVDEGLAPGSLEVEPPMRALFAALRRWPLMRALNTLGVHHLLGLRAGDLPCRLAPHLGIVECDAASHTLPAIAAGRALERAWLAATAAGVALQPFAAAMALLRQPAGGAWVSAQAQARLRTDLASLTGGRPDSAWIFVRVGLAAPPSVAAGRPPLDRFLAR